MTTPNLLLSIFPGIDLLGRAFEQQGYCIVRGPDLLWGGQVEDFNPPPDVFEGVIGGSPCQDFSRARRSAPTGEGQRLLAEFGRVVTQALPDWWLLENVVGVPDLPIHGYTVQRLNLNAIECGSPQHRLRSIQFGSRDGVGLVLDDLERRPRRDVTELGLFSLAESRRDSAAAALTRTDTPERCAMASEGRQQHRRDWSAFCVLQGLPPDFVLPGMSRSGRYRAVGNGVPLPMGRVLAIAVRRRLVTQGRRVCVCECGRPVRGGALHATAACRKRMERRRRDIAGSDGRGPVTPEQSHAPEALPFTRGDGD